MQAEPSRDITIIGGGLAGALMAILLAQRGWSVDVFERRGDPRVEGYAGGRSINLALAERGLHALRQAGADKDVLKQAVMMRGRFVHPLHGQPGLQRYGRDDSEVIWSINRGELNIVLLDIAESHGARLHFDHALDRVEFDAKLATYRHHGIEMAHPFNALIGADGAGSTLRGQIAPHLAINERTEWLDHGYKELEIPPAVDATSASNRMRCTSGRAAITCASPCPMTSAPSPSPCSCRMPARIPRSKPWRMPMPRSSCSRPSSRTPCR